MSRERSRDQNTASVNTSSAIYLSGSRTGLTAFLVFLLCHFSLEDTFQSESPTFLDYSMHS